MGTTVTQKAGVAWPGLIGAVFCWFPSLILSEESALLLTFLMPAWGALLWWSYVARSPVRSQRVGIPLVTLVLVWVIGPVLMSQDGWMYLGPRMTLMMATYDGSLFGLFGLTGLSLILAAIGLLPTAGHGSSSLRTERESRGP